MSRLFLIRLALDFLAAGLFLVALAYYWLSNAAHEVIGTAMFGLLILHNAFNRRWYGAIARRRRDGRGFVTILLNLSLLIIMLVLLVSSVVISREVFGFLPVEGGLAARDVHMSAAYLALIIVSIHLGMSWAKILNALNKILGIADENPVWTATLRVIAFSIAAFGVQSSFDMAIGSKLVLYYSLDVWDFRNDAFGFFLRYVSIIGLYATLSHYTMSWLRKKERGASRVPADAAVERGS